MHARGLYDHDVDPRFGCIVSVWRKEHTHAHRHKTAHATKHVFHNFGTHRRQHHPHIFVIDANIEFCKCLIDALHLAGINASTALL